MTIKVNETAIEIGNGLLAFERVDAILHPTNNFLWFSGAFNRFLEIGGQQLEQHATEQGPIDVGQAIIAPAGRLNAKHIIHMAVWGQDLIVQKINIYKALIAGLELATTNHCRSIALPIIGADSVTFSLIAAIEATIMALVEHCLQSTTITHITILVQSHKEEQHLMNILHSIESTGQLRDGHHGP